MDYKKKYLKYKLKFLKIKFGGNLTPEQQKQIEEFNINDPKLKLLTEDDKKNFYDLKYKLHELYTTKGAINRYINKDNKNLFKLILDMNNEDIVLNENILNMNFSYDELKETILNEMYIKLLFNEYYILKNGIDQTDLEKIFKKIYGETSLDASNNNSTNTRQQVSKSIKTVPETETMETVPVISSEREFNNLNQDQYNKLFPKLSTKCIENYYYDKSTSNNKYEFKADEIRYKEVEELMRKIQIDDERKRQEKIDEDKKKQDEDKKKQDEVRRREMLERDAERSRKMQENAERLREMQQKDADMPPWMR